MNKKVALSLGLLLFSLLGIVLFQACDKDTYCYLDVMVVNSDTHATIPDALVIINVNESSISDTGYTNSNGLYETKFAAPGIFNVNVRKNATDQFQRDMTGFATVRLKEGETVTTTVSCSPIE